MKNKKSKKKCIRSSDALFSTMERLKIGLLLLILAVFFQFLARNVNGFAQWYATSIYRILVTIISRVCSVFPFSIVEILLYVLLVVLVAGGMSGIYRICRKIEKISTIALKGSSWVCLLVGVLFFVYTMACGINYHRTSFAKEAAYRMRNTHRKNWFSWLSILRKKSMNWQIRFRARKRESLC